MKLMAFIFTLSLSSSAVAFVKDKNLSNKFIIYEKQGPAKNSGITLKTKQPQADRNSEKVESKQYPEGLTGNWHRIRKAK